MIIAPPRNVHAAAVTTLLWVVGPCRGSGGAVVVDVQYVALLSGIFVVLAGVLRGSGVIANTVGGVLALLLLVYLFMR